MLERNKKWQDPGWQYPRGKPSEYALDYAERVRTMKSVRAVWALVRGTILDI
jgi:hypothetical protein